MTINSNFQDILPGVLIFESDLSFGSTDKFIQAHEHIKNNQSEEELVKNSLWDIFNDRNDLESLKEIQSNILSSVALYCDHFDEAIHSIQWQEKIKIFVDGPGTPEKTFNPSRSTVDSDGFIDQVPFSRQICVEYFINDDYDGGLIEWGFFDYPEFKPHAGNILVYPGFFLYTKRSRPILKNTKVSLFTSFNGGKDYVSENRSIDLGHNELLFSYMR